MDGKWAADAGRAHPPPVTATAAVPHPLHHEGVEPLPNHPARAPGLHSRAGGPVQPVHPPPTPPAHADTEDAAGYILDTQELLREVDACLEACGCSPTGVVLARAKAWLARERTASGRAQGQPGWRASVAALRPALTALVAAADSGSAPDLAAWKKAAQAGRAALELEERALEEREGQE